MSYLITAGGTAGHIYPALAVAAELKKLGKEVIFVGSIGGMEEQMAQDAGFAYQAFAAKGFDRQNPFTLISSSLLLSRSTGKARAWLRSIDAEAVAAFGGYASVPVGRAAAKEGVPLLIQEQNSHMGWTNKHLSKSAEVIALAYPAAADKLSEAEKKRVQFTGNPVRQQFSVLSDATAADKLRQSFRNELGFSEDALVLLVTGGSQGARHINQALVSNAPALLAHKELCVLHLTGRKEWQSVKDSLEAVLGEALTDEATVQAALKRWKLLDYCDNMPAAFASSDFVLSRAGASSLAELAVAAKPALLVPFPYATDDHQRKNAESLVEAGAALMVPDAELDGSLLLTALLSLVNDAELRAKMTVAAKGIERADAASRIAQLLMSIAR